jgi:hypothetical protein
MGNLQKNKRILAAHERSELAKQSGLGFFVAKRFLYKKVQLVD